MNDKEKSTVWIGAFRYYMGRMTYAVSDFCDILIKEWPSLPEHAKQIIKRDLEEGFERDDRLRSASDLPTIGYALGHDCDRAEWAKVRALWDFSQQGRGGEMSRYRCAHCKKVVTRDSNKKWIPSLCVETGKMVRLQRVKK
jgi:hypothetical protein